MVVAEGVVDAGVCAEARTLRIFAVEDLVCALFLNNANAQRNLVQEVHAEVSDSVQVAGLLVEYSTDSETETAGCSPWPRPFPLFGSSCFASYPRVCVHRGSQESKIQTQRVATW